MARIMHYKGPFYYTVGSRGNNAIHASYGCMGSSMGKRYDQSKVHTGDDTTPGSGCSRCNYGYRAREEKS